LNVQLSATLPRMADDEVPWLSDDERRTWIAVSALIEVLSTSVDAQLKRDAGLNLFEYLVMAGLSEAPDRAIRMSDLAAFASGSLSRLSHAVSRLEKQGFVVRRAAVDDPRSTEAVLTDAGMAKMVASAPDHVREVRRLLIDQLTPTQLAQLGRISRQLLEHASPGTARRIEQVAPGTF
jgi:DNA-binding MarR family transcriptional regulator